MEEQSTPNIATTSPAATVSTSCLWRREVAYQERSTQFREKIEPLIGRPGGQVVSSQTASRRKRGFESPWSKNPQDLRVKAKYS